MATKILAAVLTLCILATQGALIRKDDDLFLTAMHTLLTEPEMLMDAFGLTREKRNAQGAWDFDHSFGGVTLQIKYKDPTNKWKGGHAHFEVVNLEAWVIGDLHMVHVARRGHVSADITFEGGAVPRDGIFSLKAEYILEHGFEERGIFEFNRKHVGNYWISDISNKQNGGENGTRAFPEMEFHEKTDRSTMYTATFNSDSVKLDIKTDPGKKLDGTIEGTFLLGKYRNITFNGTMNSVNDKHNGTLTIDTRIAGYFKNTYRYLNHKLSWVVDCTNGTKFIIKLNSGQLQDIVLKFSRTANWDSIKFSFAIMGTELVAFRITREISGTWNRKTTVEYRGVFFKDREWISGIFGKIGGPGKMLLQVQEVNALTKRFTVIMESKNENEFLKYVNTISHNTLMHGGHRQLAMTMKANMDLKQNSTIQKYLCKDPNSIHCFKHSETDITFNLNLDEPWHMLFVAKLNQDGSNVMDAKIDTKSQNLQTPHVFHLKAHTLHPATFDADVKKVGNNVVGIVKIDDVKKFEVTHTVGKIDRTRDHGKLHVHYHPDVGKDIEIDLERTHKDSTGKQEHHFMGKVQRNKEVYYEYDSTISYGGNSSQFELDTNSNMTVKANSHLHKFACSPEMSAFNFLCFTKRTMETVFCADKTKPYKMKVNTKVDKDGAEVFRIDMQTLASPYKLTLNWPRMRAIIAPYRQGPLEITANHNPGTSLAITSNIQGFSQFSAVKMPNGKINVTLNNQEVVTTDFWTSGRSITQSTTLPDGRALMTTFKWGNDNNWLNNHIELDLNGTEKMLDSKFEWNFRESQGTWKLDTVGQNNGWGDYNIHRTGKYKNNNGVWTFDMDGTALWKGNNVETDVFIKLDTHKIGNGKLDAITAKLIKVLDGKKYEVSVTDGKITPGDIVKVGNLLQRYLTLVF